MIKLIPETRSATPLGRWLTTVLGSALMVAAALSAVGIVWSTVLTLEFLGWVLLVLCLELLVVGSVIERTHRRIGHQRITLASWITIARAGALAMLVGFLVVGPTTERMAWVPSILFGIAAVLDGVDGAIARATESVTELGGRLDTEVDALTTLVGASAVVAAGTAPIAFIAVGVARYAFALGLWWRRRRGRPVRELPPNRARAPLSVVTLLAIWIAFLPVVDERVSMALTAAVAIPFLLNFAIDWVLVTRRSGRRTG
ncbi:CDP-alcohol phosphatidyltransferase family protein [Halostagnicola bangensis]